MIKRTPGFRGGPGGVFPWGLVLETEVLQETLREPLGEVRWVKTQPRVKGTIDTHPSLISTHLLYLQARPISL